MTWSLEYQGISNSFAELGISNVKRVRKNLLTDKVSFCVQGDSLLSAPKFSANSAVKIFCEGEKWFEGIVTQTPLYCSGTNERYEYEISGVWWFLENLIYQQTWKESVDPEAESPALRNVYKSRIILEQGEEGNPISIGAQITEILEYGISCGANLAIGHVEIDVNIPMDECKDLSCADAIRRILRWVLDTICSIDYSADVPKISFHRRAQMPTVALNLSSGIGSFSIQPRHDLQIPAVVLKFETTNSVNGKAWKESVQQKFPENCTGTELKALVLTINLEGSQASYVIQELSVAAVDINSISWWQAHIPGLNNVPSANISIRDMSRTSTLPNELISGTIAGWMDKTAEQDIVRCKISYHDSSEAVVDREVAVRIIATDATSGSYQKLTALTTAESVPNNLAEQIFHAVNPLQYDGMLEIVFSELTQNYFGKLLNLHDGQPAWSNMNAVVQETAEHLDMGKIFIKFGPSKHLGAADLAELTRSGRALFSNRNHADRFMAEVSGNGTIEQGTRGRIDNTSFGTGKYKMIKFADPSNSNKSVQIDTADVEITTATVKFREEDVCESGVLKKRYSLASEPYYG